jgi:molecular chaperone GrpE
MAPCSAAVAELPPQESLNSVGVYLKSGREGAPGLGLRGEEGIRLSEGNTPAGKEQTGEEKVVSPENLLSQEKRKNEEYLTRLKYLQADFENYRKRAGKELKDTVDSSLRGLVTTLLSTLDELELAIENARKGEHNGELLDGLKMVQKNLVSSLEAAGLSKIDCVGKPFDPSLHEAVEKVEGSSAEKDTVVGEIRPGYTFRGRVIRPSMAKVELAPRTPEEAKVNE